MSSTLQEHESSSAATGAVAHTPQVGDLLVSYLEQIGVEYVFGIPGGAIEPLYNAMARSARRGGLRPIVARHETGAAFMADGYTRETGKLGVCCATTGPGATNLITGVASAYADNIPMLVITAQTPLHTFGKGAFQESSTTGINVDGIFQHCTRYSSLVSHIEQFEGKLVAAIMTAFQAPRGPVHLSLPLDILRTPSLVSAPSFQLDRMLEQEEFFRENSIEELLEHIAAAENIALLVGSGCGEAIGDILEFAQRINASVLTTPTAKGLVSSYHPLYKGVFGFAGHNSAYTLLASPQVDLIIAVGTGLGEWDSRGWDTVLMNNRLIHIDSDAEHLVRSPMARMHIYGKLHRLFKVLLKCHSNLSRNIEDSASDTAITQEESVVGKRNTNGVTKLVPLTDTPPYLSADDVAACHDDAIPIKPQRLMYELSRRFPLDTRFLVDTGNSFAWATHYLHPHDRRIAGSRSLTDGSTRSAMGLSAMGWAIGGAVGTALGRLGVPVVCITGDGSFLMSGQEITVAVAESLPVIFIVLNDGALGMVKHGQQLAGAEPVGFELPQVDFCALAKAVGADAYTIRSPQDISNLNIKEICKRQGPTLLDIRIDPEEVPPMAVRIRTLSAVH